LPVLHVPSGATGSQPVDRCRAESPALQVVTYECNHVTPASPLTPTTDAQARAPSSLIGTGGRGGIGGRGYRITKNTS
jgi:hypothetical protein